MIIVTAADDRFAMPLVEITELTTKRYHEREVNESPVLKASGVGWNASGMHHIDPHLLDDGRWIACVDGQVAFKA